MTNSQPGIVRRILVVDDNVDFLFLLHTLLHLEGYSVWKAERGRQALAILAQENIDLIISDIQMPEMDGLALHQNVRALPQYLHTPFIFISGYKDTYRDRLDLVPGQDLFLDKAAPCESMLEAVQQLLDGTQSAWHSRMKSRARE